MPKGKNQKFKLYRLAQIMLENTDEEHYITMPEIKEKLEEYEVTADRKSIYNNLKDLEKLGIEVEGEPVGNRYHYHVVSRTFELPELKLLVDAVQSSRFITSGKSRQLIGKLESLASVHEARQLRRQVFVQNRVRTMNESVYYSIDEIQRALTEDRQISFQYCEWTVEKELRLKKNGERYRVSPWGLVWQNENYYLVACDEKCGRVKHYRVDKIMQIRLEEAARSGRELFENYDAGELTSRTFGMFGGKEETRRFLENLGFVTGGVVTVVSEIGGNMIVNVKDSRVAIGKDMANKIMV